MAQAWLKAALLAVTSVSLDLSIRAPHPPPADNDRLVQVTLVDRALVIWEWVLRCAFYAVTLCPALVVLASMMSESTHASQIPPLFCPRPSSPPAIASITLPFVLGIVLIILGTLLRLWCYRTLGKHFTFQVALRKEHELITSGPYAFVRHPSYTGIFAVFAGFALLAFAQGGYVKECGLLRTSARWTVWSVSVMLAALTIAIGRRPAKEDEMLRATFGEQWIAWSSRVRWRLVPGVC